MAFTSSMESHALREYEARCATINRLLDKILASDSLAFAKETAFEVKEILQHGL